MWKQMVQGGAALLAVVGVQTAMGAWMNLVSDDFSVAPTNWTYAGVSNIANEALFRHDAANQRIAAEWDQQNTFVGSDPLQLGNSWYTRALPRRLTDRHSFRLRAALRIDANSVSDTTEFHQIATIGLFGLEHMGPDRSLSDDPWSLYETNLHKRRNGSDFVEFNYFINNNAFGVFNPNISATIGARVNDDLTFAYYTGTGADTGWFHDTDMGADHYLPEDSNLYLELLYHGGATGAVSRRASVALYTDAARTSLLEVNGVPQYYWTQPLPAHESFELTHVALVNYVAANWGGANAEGSGSWDDVSVDWAVSEGRVVLPVKPASPALAWAAVSGTTYAVVSTPDLVNGPFTTQALVMAESDMAGWTSSTPAALQFLFVEPMDP